MMEEQFVSFDTAKLLKEAGFKVPCRGVYVTDRTGYYEFREYDNKQTTDDLCWDTEDGFQYEYLAPTQALAARWLREVHKLHVFADCDTFSGFYAYTIRRTYNVDEIKVSNLQYPSYEQALEAGLQEAIKLIKK